MSSIESDIIVLMYDFIYSLVIHRAIHVRGKNTYNLHNVHERFWNTISDNCIQQCVVDWCKVFGSNNDKTHYTKIHSVFIDDFERAVAAEKINLSEYSKSMRNFRDKFIAHRDAYEQRTPIPCLDQALIICDLFERTVLHGECIVLEISMMDFYQKSAREISEYLDSKHINRV